MDNPVRIGVRNVPTGLDVDALVRPRDTVVMLGPHPVPPREVNVVVCGGPHQVQGPALVLQIGGIPIQALSGRLVVPIVAHGPAYYAPTLSAELMGISGPDLVFEAAGDHRLLPPELRLRHDISLIATNPGGGVAIAATRRDAGGWAYWITEALQDPTAWARRLLDNHRRLMRGRLGWWTEIRNPAK